MEADEYRKRAKEMVDYIVDYLENIRERRVFPDVRPGYMRELLPDRAPDDGEAWEDIFKDVERVIMPGVTHWQSPYMHAYFPALNSYPSLLGDMLANGINCLGFTWASSPACTELETIVMDWLGKMIGLPEEFLHSKPLSPGGGVIQTTASESTFVCLLAGRTEAIKRYQKLFPDIEDADINSRLVAYCSDQAHSSVEKAGLIGLVKIRYIESDERLSLRGDKLKEAIQFDRDNGLIPFFLCATLGTTGACSFDNLNELGPICKEEEMWLHVDAAYAGSAFVCPEFRKFMSGIEYADSIAFNPSKWLMVHFDCTAMWVKNSRSLHRTFNVDPLYLQHENSGLAIDYMHWQVPLSKRFRALKLWFVLRNYGVKGLQSHIRHGVRLAQKFEALVRDDDRFEIPAERHLGMVVFRLKGDNSLTEQLLKKLNSSGKLHAVPASLKGKYVIRFTVTSPRTTINDIARDWQIIRSFAQSIVGGPAVEPLQETSVPPTRTRMKLKDIKEKSEHFGTSLLLANIGPNSAMSPKIVNGSYAALFENQDVVDDFHKKLQNLRHDMNTSGWIERWILTGIKPKGCGGHLELEDKSRQPVSVWGPRIPPSVATKRRVRGMAVSNRSANYSLDSRMDIAQTGLQSFDEPHSAGGGSVRPSGVCDIAEEDEEGLIRVALSKDQARQLENLFQDGNDKNALNDVKQLLITIGALRVTA